MSHPVRVALIQQQAADSKQKNLETTLQRIHAAADQGAQIVCTQELFLTRYFCQTEDHAHFALAESIPGPTTDVLTQAARERRIVIVASLFERRAAGLYHNTAVVIDADGTLAGKYRKMHIPDDPLFYEKFYFTPGDLGFRSFPTQYGRVGVLVCWDQWYPEAARLTALTGAQILFYPTAIGWQPPEKEEFGERQHSSWETIQRSHAIANGVFVASPNRVGFEPGPTHGIEFWGQSFISDPSGLLLARGSASEEEIVSADCDFSELDVQRTHWPFLRDRRIDAYGGITSRYLD
jgi:N-carbamoylputrescine amidase